MLVHIFDENGAAFRSYFSQHKTLRWPLLCYASDTLFWFFSCSIYYILNIYFIQTNRSVRNSSTNHAKSFKLCTEYGMRRLTSMRKAISIFSRCITSISITNFIHKSNVSIFFFRNGFIKNYINYF